MQGRVAVHVRSRAGAVVVTVVEFNEMSAVAESYADAVEALRPQLEKRLAALDAVDRLPFHDDPPPAQLFRVPVSVRAAKDEDPFELDLGVVVLTRRIKSRTRHLAYVPVVPNFVHTAASGDVEAIAGRAALAAAKRMKRWSANAILAADEPDDTYLDVVEVRLATGPGDDGDSPTGILDEYGVDLTHREGGRIDRRDELVRRTLETLAAPDRSSVLLVGRPDVGKSALVHEIARRMAAGDVPDPLRGRRLWRLSANELIAGAQYTGQWQGRVRGLVDQARSTRAVVAMGDPVGIVDAGRWSGSDNNASRFLRPYVESGDITLICECTAEQLDAAYKKEPSFVDAFHRIEVPEPTLDETRHISRAAAARIAEASRVEVTDGAIEAALALTRRFEPHRSFPGKSLRLVEDAVRERPEDAERIDHDSVTETFARRTGMPLALLSDAVPLSMSDVRRHFELRVVAQPAAVAAMTDVIAVIKSGLNGPERPLGTFFFVGPTGVGKTELAKALAEFLFGSRDRLVRLDMGEYSTPDAVARLVGTAWGREGELTKQVRRQPFCVVLLDELEKADSGVFGALLAALGEGRLTDASGRTADFRNAIVIMTSNLGARRAETQALGFRSNGGRSGSHYVEEAEKFFRPEFFNRIDRIVVFHALGSDAVRRIARRELEQLIEREGIVRRGIRVEVDDAVVDHVAAAGFHPRYGARPLQREIAQSVIGPLAHALLRKPPLSNDLVRVHLTKGAVAVSIERIDERPRALKRAERRTTVDVAAFTKARRAAEQFVAALDEDEASTYGTQVETTLSALIHTTHHPSFWDEPERARATLQRIYRLERAVDALAGLRTRAEGLVTMAERVAEARDRSRLREIGTAVAEMSDRLMVVRLELAAAAVGADQDRAFVRVVPVGRDASSWADRLLAMYEAWADRTGRDVARADRRLEIAGPASFDLLQGEAGLHRLVQAERLETLARVVVSDTAGASSPDETEAGVVVRVYEEGARQGVRDPRTGERRSHVAAVLDEGRVDPFLIAWLRETSREPRK